MITTTIDQDNERVEFVKAAIKVFQGHASLSTYGSCMAGSLLAIRWGLMDRSILVVRSDPAFEPIVYEDATVEQEKAE